MIYRIAHWYLQRPPVPDLPFQIDEKDGHYEIEIDDLNAFVEKYGPIIVSPPGRTPYEAGWWIWVTDDTGKFSQK